MRFGKMPSSCLCFCKASAQRKPWLAFLVGFWLAGLVWLAFWLVWFGSWLVLVWLLAGFGLAPCWFGLAPGWLSGWFGLAPGWLSGCLVWLLAGFGLAPGWFWFGSWLVLVWLLAGFGLAPGWLSGWFGLAPGWLAGFLAGLAWLFFFSLFFLARLAETQLLGILQAYLGVSILQPHACTQRFRLRILRRTRSNAGRTSAGSLSGRI